MQMSVISAVVILASGGQTGTVVDTFASKGFETQIVSTETLLVIAEPSLFENTFDIEIQVGPNGAFVQEKSDGSEDVSLTRTIPVEALPASVSASIAEMAFDEPPSFGPSDF